jgi:murein DD-endopeptidase MepM/ murein hydrolase activator NlpD
MARSWITPARIIVAFTLLAALALTCALIAIIDGSAWLPGGANSGSSDAAISGNGTSSGSTSDLQLAADPLPTPTPDAPRVLPTLRSTAEQYVVQPGDSLNQIAQAYTVDIGSIVEANGISQPDLLEVGQTLTIPAPQPLGTGPAFKVIPDAELIYGPASADFNPAVFIHEQDGYLSRYREDIDAPLASTDSANSSESTAPKEGTTGVKILERVAREFSVNPRLLLAVLEYQSGWVTQAEPDEGTLDYPLGVHQEWRKGLYRQLAWAADNLNRGFYLWRVNGVGAWILADGGLVLVNPTINAGTAGVQHFFSELSGYQDWNQDVTEAGFYRTYQELFGDPFQYALEPLLPLDLSQPAMQLPFEEGRAWSFTGGPHGGWGSGSAWAALDFAPPEGEFGCVQSDAWVVAVADGLIVRAEGGAVVQDLDNDGLEQTGWTVLYMHIETRGRVREGTLLRAGDRIGHPSCEGGVSTGTHVHLARRYNGEWIPADQDIPFVLDGWASQGLGREYDGILIKDGQSIEAWEGRIPANEIRR